MSPQALIEIRSATPGRPATRRRSRMPAPQRFRRPSPRAHGRAARAERHSRVDAALILPEPPLHIADGQIVQAARPVPGRPADAGAASAARDTRDPRYWRCTDHHLACDCRPKPSEAERNEALTEMRADLQSIHDVMKGDLEGHPTRVYDRTGERRDLECRCTGCRIARSIRGYGPDNMIHI